MSKKSILQKLLAWLARETARVYKPRIIGITGSVGKTSTKEAIYAVLKSKFKVRQAEKNYNNEIGLPLAILGAEHQGKSIVGWFLVLLRSYVRLLFNDPKYPEMLILEYGIDHPGDMDYLLSIARPFIGVVTAIGDVPAHVEFFKDAEELIQEKAKLVAILPQDGFAVLNHDDYAVYDMKEKTAARAITFGFSAQGGFTSGGEEHAEMRASNFSFQTIKDAELGDVPAGIVFKLEYRGNIVPVRLKGVLGNPPVYAATAAATVGAILQMNLVDIAEALQNYVSPPGRMRLLEGIKHSFILDDTYNAAPEAMRSALDTLKALPGTRKIAVLGDMLEIGKYTEQAHRSIGDGAADFVDMLITVGPRAKFIADEALTRGIEPHPRILERSQVLSFDDAESAGKELDSLIRAGDLVLVKGSQAMRMEKTVLEIMARPDKAAEFLVRQEEYWKML